LWAGALAGTLAAGEGPDCAVVELVAVEAGAETAEFELESAEPEFVDVVSGAGVTGAGVTVAGVTGAGDAESVGASRVS
jgi:uncharacterized cupin superfamily protein